ncbi:MAG: N-acetylmuramoyl-L-alanine amidase [Gemmatimonadetes bacterium]|nr:N-acetylmuramoyl-L-alanine amidase [Gemmatimonadota bacterium]
MPTIYTTARTGLRFVNRFGALGPENYVTGHYSASRRDTSDRDAIALVQSFHRYHKEKGWGGLGYHYVITKKGNIILGRPTYLKGAHVGGHNTGNVGVMMLGTTGHRPTFRQRRAYRWLLANAHTSKLPRAHRTDRSLRRARRRGHNSWSGHTSNGCPGSFKPMYLRGY